MSSLSLLVMPLPVQPSRLLGSFAAAGASGAVLEGDRPAQLSAGTAGARAVLLLESSAEHPSSRLDSGQVVTSRRVQGFDGCVV